MFSKTINKIERNLGLNISQLSTLLLSLSIIIWSISIYFSKLEIGDYGLIQGLNPLFFVAIGLLTVSFFITIKYNTKNKKLLIMHLISIFLFTALIPILIEGTPRFPYNFQTAQNVDYITQYAHSNADIMQYQTWPGVFYFDTIITLISNISPFNSILIIPLLFGFFIGLPVSYLFYSTFLNKKETWAALLLTNVLFFGSPIYLLPGVVGGLMATFALLIFLRFELINSRDSWGMRILFIIFCAGAVVSHFLSSIYLLMALIFFSILLIICKRDMDKKFILLFVLIATWQVYIAGSYAIDQVAGSISTAFHLEKTVSATQTAAFGGSQTHTQIIYVKIISIVMVSILAFIGLFYEIMWKRKFTLKNLALPTWISANFSITLLTSYSGEILSRTFAASSSALYMLGAKIINNNKLSLILLLVLIIAPPLSIINAYGNEAVDYVSYTEIAGANFFFDYHADNSVILSLGQRALIYRYYSDFQNWAYDPNNATLEKIIPVNQRPIFNRFYILVGQKDIDQYTFLNGQTDLSFLRDIDSSHEYNRIYDSPGFTLYQIVV